MRTNSDNFLNHPKLKGLLDKSRSLMLLNRQLAEILDEPLKSHVCVMNESNATLVLGASSGAVLARLKITYPDLLKRLAFYPGTQHIKKLKYKVMPPANQRTAKVKQPNPISKENEAIWQEIRKALQGIKK